MYLFTKSILRNRKMILQMSINDIKNRYSGSTLGLIWSLLQPLSTICIYWFVFQIGFKTGKMEGVDYILWFMCGIVPWFYFSDVLIMGTSSLVEYSYIVKKVVFDTSIVPLIKVVSALIVHIFFIGMLLVVNWLLGNHFSIYLIQIPYYLVCTILLGTAVILITSSITPFVKDMLHAVNIFLQIGFWLAPITWSYDILDNNLQEIFKCNPFYYIVDGYRDSLFRGQWFWDKPAEMLYFLAVVFLLLSIGIKLFNSSKPHFADVL